MSQKVLATASTAKACASAARFSSRLSRLQPDSAGDSSSGNYGAFSSRFNRQAVADRYVQALERTSITVTRTTFWLAAISMVPCLSACAAPQDQSAQSSNAPQVGA